VSYRKESETEIVAIATAGDVYTSISRLLKSLLRSIWSLKHDESCIFIGCTPRSLHVEHTVVDECKQLGDGKLYNATHCKRICWRPTLAANTKVLEHCYAAKVHLVHSIWGTHKGDFERNLLKQQPALDIIHSNQYQVRVQVNTFESKCIQSARDNTAELCDFHHFHSDAECLEFIESLLADNKHLFPVAKLVEGGVHCRNPRQREL